MIGVLNRIGWHANIMARAPGILLLTLLTLSGCASFRPDPDWHHPHLERAQTVEPGLCQRTQLPHGRTDAQRLGLYRAHNGQSRGRIVAVDAIWFARVELSCQSAGFLWPPPGLRDAKAEGVDASTQSHANLVGAG